MVLRAIFAGFVSAPLAARSEENDETIGSDFSWEDVRRRQEIVEDLIDHNQWLEASRMQELDEKVLFTSTSVETKSVDRNETGFNELIKTIQEAATILGQSDPGKSLRFNFVDSQEKPIVERPNEFDHYVNGWNESVAPSCNGVRFVSGFVADYCLGISAFTEQYAYMKNANNKTMVLRCDLRGGSGSMFDGQDKYRHCMANCEATNVGVMGLLAAMQINIIREVVDVARKPLLSTYKSYKEHQEFGLVARPESGGGVVSQYGRNLIREAADSIDDMKANFKGISGGVKGLRCRDACDGYRPFYIVPKP